MEYFAIFPFRAIGCSMLLCISGIQLWEKWMMRIRKNLLKFATIMIRKLPSGSFTVRDIVIR
jgi:hypothetical protein